MQYLHFNNKYTKKINTTKVEHLKFNWHFIGFPNIININDLYTFVNHQLNATLNKVQEDDLTLKINQLRELFDKYTVKIEKYKLDIDNNLDNFFIKSYSLTKNFINNTLFNYIFFSHIHQDIKFKNNLYDIDDFYLWQFKTLEIEFLKLYIQMLTSANGKVNGFDLMILAKKQQLSVLKSNIKKYHYSIII
ncbi:hypothetical protein [Spiroplasma culicicola]|uniref:Uncharacterized protein n=1 Tax=Spiroplasma culicicola AES-1 TaxID=1276246 RepID=W6A8B3_9MOLU|nr:hypothetical protein [Spiroplasma culicicola]AHI53135.1 hypothetical protein SCULI_v1c07940 [Spiroplasma culicicola AES-1]